ncbi:MAG: C25 family cysteine peptidase [Planctomycetota bacterium]
MRWNVRIGLAIITCLTLIPLGLAADPISINYDFDRPQTTEITIDGQQYHRIIMPACPNGGNVGSPALPARGARILLPYGTDIARIEVLPAEKVLLGTGFRIEPVGNPIPLSADPATITPPTPDPLVYASKQALPSQRFEQSGTHAFRGYQILYLKLHPVTYVPATGELYYYPRLTINVHTIETGRASSMLRGLEQDQVEVSYKVDNPSVANTYPTGAPRTDRSYDLLIITTMALTPDFQPLKTYHDANGLATEIHTTTDIGSTDPDDIRDYIRDRYMYDGIQYVIIGADDDIIPAQDMWVQTNPGGTTEYNMPTDMYFGCLDGTWNYDGDGYMGEPNDGEGGGDVDLVAEVYIGRAAVGDSTEATRFVNKTIWYLSGMHTQPEKVLLVGEYLGFGGPSEYAADTLEELIDGSDAHGYVTVGIPSDLYDIEELFERDMNWTQSDLVNRINAGVHFLNHLGHGNVNYAMKLYTSDVLSLIDNDDLCLVYSQTCLAGHFDDADCWAEYMNIKIDDGSFAVIMNARYGYGAYSSTDGPSQRFNREFWDAVYNPDEGLPQLGRANQDSKEDNIYRINESCMRWCTYELNLFGDPSVELPGADGFRLIPDPVAQSLCSPPDDQAVYTIAVDKIGDFVEPITLVASGAPANATVSFDVNSSPPPFTSVMTIGNIDSSAAGDYDIQITGTAVSLQRGTVVGLTVAGGLPAPVSLVSPVNGALEVPLKPELVWDGEPTDELYELEIASDSGFNNIIYSTTTSASSHTVSLPLNTLSLHFWHVRASNACGTGEYSATYSFTTVNMIGPIYYDMLNGETGTYTYFDDIYDGDGNPAQPLSPLSNGLGELTDGVIATQHWNQNNTPYVGWVSVDPTITFHFAQDVSINVVVIHIDDDGGGGGVHVPSDVTITMGESTVVVPVEDPPGDEPIAVTFADLGMFGDTLELTLADHSTSGYMMLSEVEFYGGQTNMAGDCNCDGAINSYDIDPFICALSVDCDYETKHPECNRLSADCNGDGEVNSYDIDPFIALVGG